MPEPDFDQMARDLLDAFIETNAARPQQIVDYFRSVWNARGAADVATLEAELSSMMGVTAAGPYVKNLDRAIRKGDR